MLETIANIAAIFLILQGLVVLVVVAGLCVGLAKAMMVLRHKTVEVMPQVQGQARRLAATTDNVSQKVSSPFISLDTRQARFRAMRRAAFVGAQRHPHTQPENSEE
ncbi:MAG: hypothetical protein V9H69_26450 [Anaerolineae bacterium]